LGALARKGFVDVTGQVDGADGYRSYTGLLATKLTAKDADCSTLSNWDTTGPHGCQTLGTLMGTLEGRRSKNRSNVTQ